MADLDDESKACGDPCGYCGAPGSRFRCGSCGQVFYCSSDCQKMHWGSHKKCCIVAEKKVKNDGDAKKDYSELADNPKQCGRCGARGTRFRCECKQVWYCGDECKQKDWDRHKMGCIVDLAEKVQEEKKKFGRDSIEVAKARIGVGHAHGECGRFLDAEKCFLEAHRIIEAAGAGESEDMALVCISLGSLVGAHKGNLEEASRYTNEGLRIHRKIHGEHNGVYAEILMNVAENLRQKGRLEEGLAHMEQAYLIKVDIYGPDHLNVASVLCDMGRILQKLGREDEALAKQNKALQIARSAGGDQGEHQIAESLKVMAELYSASGMNDDALAMYEEVLEIHHRLNSENYPYAERHGRRVGWKR